MIPFQLSLLVRALRLTFSPRYFRLRLVPYALVMTAAVLGFLTMVQLFRLLDLVLFPGYRRQRVRAPLYIVANPRSGTTFLQRLLTHDRQFTWFQLWQTVLPTVGLYRLIDGLVWLDARSGGLGRRLVGAINRVAFGGWEGIHRVGFERPEEDEMLWLYTVLSPALVLLFPWLDEFPETVHVDAELPPSRRQRLARYYRDAVQRHVYATREHGAAKPFLAKNVLHAGRIRTMLEAFPDMRIVHLVRHPYQAIPSLLSMFTAPWEAHSPHLVPDSDEVHALARMAIDYYKLMAELERELPEGRIVTITYDELMADPRATVARVYDHFDLEMSAAFQSALDAELDRQRGYRSRHDYSLEEFGISRVWIHRELEALFDRFGFEPDVRADVGGEQAISSHG